MQRYTPLAYRLFSFPGAEKEAIMPRGKNKHLTIEDRVIIQNALDTGESFASAARRIGVSTSTVTREVAANRTFWVPKGKAFWNLCVYRRDCTRSGVCNKACSIASCKGCARVRCNEVCPDFVERKCELIGHAPYVCGDCHRSSNCGFAHARYSAAEAQLSYAKRLVECREGVSLSPERLESLVRFVKLRLRQGWSIAAIWAVDGDRLPVCERTMYGYIEAGLMGLANIDLPKKVRYKPRKPMSGCRLVDRDGRSFSDFLDLPASRRARAVQMDTVIGKARDFRCILTIHFPAAELQMMVLIDEKTCEAVVGALDWIEGIVGTSEFARLFGVILTDRGVEFCDFEAIERSALGNGRRCRVFYCDPMASHQKGSCERNHAMIRRVLPKGTCFEELTQHDVSTVASAVNNYPRRSLGDKTPLQASAGLLPKELLDELGIVRMRPDEVVLKPSLLDCGK